MLIEIAKTIIAKIINAGLHVLFILPRKKNRIVFIPYKFYESLALGKPMIVCRGTGIDKIVEAYNLGITIP